MSRIRRIAEGTALREKSNLRCSYRWREGRKVWAPAWASRLSAGCVCWRVAVADFTLRRRLVLCTLDGVREVAAAEEGRARCRMVDLATCVNAKCQCMAM